MKIDEASINHNVALLVGDLVGGLYDFTDADNSMDHVRIAVLGEIRGICHMAEAMKKELER